MKKIFIAITYIAVALLSVLYYELYTRKYRQAQQIKIDKLSEVLRIEHQIIEVNKKTETNIQTIKSQSAYADSLALDSLFKILPR